jgi:hypothetical protein
MADNDADLKRSFDQAARNIKAAAETTRVERFPVQREGDHVSVRIAVPPRPSRKET